MSKKKKKGKRKLKKKAIIIFLIILLILVSLTAIFMNMHITNIYIKNNYYLSDEEVIEIAKLKDYPTIIDANTFKIKSNLEKSLYIR